MFFLRNSKDVFFKKNTSESLTSLIYYEIIIYTGKQEIPNPLKQCNKLHIY